MVKSYKRIAIGLSLIAIVIALSVVFATANQAVDKNPQPVVEPKDKIIEKLSRGNIDRFKENEPIRLIITLKEEATDDKVSELEKKYDMKINSKGWKQIYPNGFAATTNKKKLTELLDDPGVESIYEDEVVTAMLDTANQWSGTTLARGSFGVDGDQDDDPYNYSKEDIVIAIVDTGIDKNHTDLNGGKVIGFKDFINSLNEAYDDNGHGTHVASIAAGDGEANTNYKGVAPGAALVGVKVLDSAGSGYTSGVIAGVNWVVENKINLSIDIASLSLGSSGSSDGNDALSLALDNAVDHGIVVIVAAGNSGPRKYTIGSPGASRKAITVGAMADPGAVLSQPGQMSLGDNGFYLASFSSRGPTKDNRIKPDVVAPGVEINAAKSGTTNGYVEYSGTSMATPFVAGVAALMLDADNNLAPSQIKDIIRSTSEDWGKTGMDNEYGNGRIRAFKAVEAASVSSGGADVVTPSHVKYDANMGKTTRYKDYNVEITDISKPLAATLIMTDWKAYGGIDLDLYVYKGSTLVAKATGIERQDTISYSPASTGTYKIRVYRYSGSGMYTLDLSRG